MIDQRKKAFASWAQRFGFRGGPAAALPRSSNDLIYKGPNPDPEVIPDEMAPAQPEDVAPPQASAGNTITREELAKMQVSEEEAAELGYEVVD